MKKSGTARWVAIGCIVPCVLLFVQQAGALPESSANKLLGSKPAIERRIVVRERATSESKAEGTQLSRSRERVRQQIPQPLREQAAAAIARRIDGNLARIHSLRREALRLLRRQVQELPSDAAELPVALMRLGELEWESAREAYLVRFKAWEAQPAEQRKEPPVAAYAVARSRFARVLEEFPQFERYDLALYVDGFLATEEGDTEVALQRFNRILVEHPSSAFVADAHMVRAEAEFGKTEPDYEYALSEYEAVLQYPEAEVYQLALFKSAWTLWRMGSNESAARRFLAVLRSGSPAIGASPSTQRQLGQLQSEALKSLVAVFAEDDRNAADEMYQFLVDAGGKQLAAEIVEALAVALFQQAHYARGVEAYRLLVKLNPTNPRAANYMLSVAEGLSTLEQWPELVQTYEQILRQYLRPTSEGHERDDEALSSWVLVQDPQWLQQVERSVEKQLFQDALEVHAKAQADKVNVLEFELATRLYGLHVTRFSEYSNAYEAHYNTGDIFFHRLGNALKAADAYMAAVRIRPGGRWSRDALYNALGALERVRELEFRRAKTQGETHRESPTDNRLTAAMELYGESYPSDPVLPSMLFRQGRLYYDFEVYDVAVRHWGLLLENHPDHELSRSAGELILDSFNKSQDYSNIETWGRRLLQAPAFREAKEQAYLQQLIVQSIFKQGEQKSNMGKHAEAAIAYVRAAKEFATDKRAASAAVNGIVEAQRAMMFELLAEASSLLVDHYRGHVDAGPGVWVAAKAYQKLGLLEESADLFDSISKHWPRAVRHREASFNCVLLRTTLRQRDAAVAAGQRFLSTYKKGADADEVTFLMGKAHEGAGDWRSAADLYRRYARMSKTVSGKLESLVRLALAEQRLGDERGAQDALARAMKQRRRSRKRLDARGQYYGAQAHYLDAQRLIRQYEAIAIAGDPATLDDRLKSKALRLRRASEALLATAKLGVAEWTTAALYQVGFVYESFANALLNSPPPSHLTVEQQDDFQMQIDEFVIPIEEKSLEAYESGWKKAVELRIFNRWTAKMRAALGRLNTEQYPPVAEVGLSSVDEAGAGLPELIRAPRRTPSGQSTPYLVSAEH